MKTARVGVIPLQVLEEKANPRRELARGKDELKVKLRFSLTTSHQQQIITIVILCSSTSKPWTQLITDIGWSIHRRVGTPSQDHSF